MSIKVKSHSLLSMEQSILDTKLDSKYSCGQSQCEPFSESGLWFCHPMTKEFRDLHYPWMTVSVYSNRAITGLSQYVFWYGKKDRPSVHRREFAGCLGEYYI